jgi:Uncharacterized integral membrane protein
MLLSKNRRTPVHSPAREAMPAETSAAPADHGSPAITDAQLAPTQTPAPVSGTDSGETPHEHFRRKAHRSRLHGYAAIGVALVAYLIALAASNTARVKVSWVFGTSHVSLVWLVLFAAILGWLLGLLATAAFHWRTRARKPHRGG